MSETAKKPLGGLRLALDYGPLLVFFIVYKWSAPAGHDAIGTLSAVIRSTGAFMFAIAIAAIIAKWKLGRIPPMMWLTSILVIGFGGLTIWFNDPTFIQIKPTIIYVLLAALLGGGWLMGKPLLKYVFEAGFDGLNERGWLLLSRNWAAFFLALALLNEVVRHMFEFGTWLTIKVWGVSIASFLFAAVNIPMLLRNGMSDETETGQLPK